MWNEYPWALANIQAAHAVGQSKQHHHWLGTCSAQQALPLVPRPQAKLVDHQLQLGPVELAPAIVDKATCNGASQLKCELTDQGQSGLSYAWHPQCLL